MSIPPRASRRRKNLLQSSSHHWNRFRYRSLFRLDSMLEKRDPLIVETGQHQQPLLDMVAAHLLTWMKTTRTCFHFFVAENALSRIVHRIMSPEPISRWIDFRED